MTASSAGGLELRSSHDYREPHSPALPCHSRARGAAKRQGPTRSAEVDDTTVARMYLPYDAFPDVARRRSPAHRQAVRPRACRGGEPHLAPRTKMTCSSPLPPLHLGPDGPLPVRELRADSDRLVQQEVPAPGSGPGQVLCSWQSVATRCRQWPATYDLRDIACYC